MSRQNHPTKTFDLGVLDSLSESKGPSNQVAAVLDIPIKNIVVDENQPRKDFTDDNWDNFVADIKKRGVIRPLDIRPAVNGVHVIINGERRYRGAIEAGLDSIPAIIREDDEQFDDYAQILDNIKNKAMSPVDIALFIQKRMAVGDSKTAIAEKLSERPSYITYHLALTEMPAAVQNAYAAGRINGVQTVYQLNKLHEEDPDLVRQLLANNQELTNSLILNARKSLKTAPAGQQKENADASPGAPAIEITQESIEAIESGIGVNDHVVESTNSSNSTETPDEIPHHDLVGSIDLAQTQQNLSDGNENTIQLPYHNPENEEKPIKRNQDPDRIRKPLLLGYHKQDHACVVLIHERPLTAGFIWIKDETTGEKLHVLAEEIRLNLLTDAKEGE